MEGIDGVDDFSEVDYTIFFRELSHLPEDLSTLRKSFYSDIPKDVDDQWQAWLTKWRVLIEDGRDLSAVSRKMKDVNPKYTWREWLVVPAYQNAMEGDYSLVRELQNVFSNPYEEQSQEVEDKYYRLKPKEFFNAGGVSHYSLFLLGGYRIQETGFRRQGERCQETGFRNQEDRSQVSGVRRKDID